ncbi:NAD(P)/FAD-dependent oxidoreductase [Methylobacterium sp. J-088]|uniref:NAD(P)/FAD-dependent oxidoreductase n=1 Tax=Methylobacterium sp. J-088 TaxID=2836664 RepID=UPI001FB96A67|nr:NAD(P)/FAD-dependent oxidoreductase [Methylobacterium sp. J-088]MCJ2065759.1 NAD(P)/FAD-dependent oxidoreductase [Methylobacterium sp. J-088]
MARLIVIGAGAMGLAAGYHAAKAGHQVEVLEAGPEAGGMAAHFDFDGVSIERFYHFVCKTDAPTFKLLDEIGLGDAMRWRKTTMGYFSGGKLHPWGDPISLLRYPNVSLMARLRYGLLAFVSTRRERWDALETQSAKEWITRWSGREVYEKLWRPLFELKFYEYADNVSAAWIWTRVKRIGRSRKSLFDEQLGYIEGGSQTLVDRLVERIAAMGGSVRLSTPAKRVVTEGGRVTGVEAADGFHPADAVISTMPTPFVSAAVPDLPADWKAKYDAINNIGVCCLLFKLKRPVTPHFWVNISEPDVAIPGLIEFSNLRSIPNGESIVYVPYYMPVTNPKFSWDDERLLDEAFSYIRRVNPAIGPQDVLARKVARLRYAQPICEPGFAAKLPPVQTPIAGLQIADTCFYYPEDRGISESVRLAEEMVARIPA